MTSPLAPLIGRRLIATKTEDKYTVLEFDSGYSFVVHEGEFVVTWVKRPMCKSTSMVPAGSMMVCEVCGANQIKELPFPQRGEVREHPSGERYYIEGRPEDPSQYTEPMVRAIEVEGRWAKTGFVLSAAVVARWKIVSQPVDAQTRSERDSGTSGR